MFGSSVKTSIIESLLRSMYRMRFTSRIFIDVITKRQSSGGGGGIIERRRTLVACRRKNLSRVYPHNSEGIRDSTCVSLVFDQESEIIICDTIEFQP